MTLPVIQPPEGNPTGSKLELASLCIGSAVLGGVGEDTPYAGSGRIIHRFLQGVRDKGLEEALVEAPDDYRAICAAIDVDQLPVDPGAYAAEVAVAWDSETDEGRILGAGVDRQYGDLKPTEIATTLDVLALVDDDGVFDGDYKSGHLRVAPAARNWQIRIGLLGAARAYDRTRGIGEIIRIREDGDPWKERAEFSMWDFEAIATEARALRDRIHAARALYARTGEVEELNVGDHCRYCPARRVCPAQALLLAQLAADPEQVASRLISSNLNPANARRAFESLKAIKRLVELVEAQLELYALSNPIDLGDGYFYGQTTTNKDRLDAQKIYEHWYRTFGEKSALSVVKLKTAKTWIEDELKRMLATGEQPEVMAKLAARDPKSRGKPKAAPIERVLYRELAGAGAMSTYQLREVKVHKVKGAGALLPASPEEKREWAAANARRPGTPAGELEGGEYAEVGET